MANNESSFIHPLGQKIREYRKYRGLTQKELGDKCGLNESTIRNYELGNRYPDEPTLTNIADALEIDRYTLADPDPSSVWGAMHILFDLEKNYGLTPVLVKGQVHLVQADAPEDLTAEEKFKRLQLKQSLALWGHIRKVYEEGNLLDEEYYSWKSEYPDYIDQDQLYGYHEDSVTAVQIKTLDQEIRQTDNSSSAPDSNDAAPQKRKRRTKKPGTSPGKM